LLAWIIDFFATHFGNSAILKGGMSLRLMQSPDIQTTLIISSFLLIPKKMQEVLSKAN
jgi:hypothetical protein